MVHCGSMRVNLSNMLKNCWRFVFVLEVKLLNTHNRHDHHLCMVIWTIILRVVRLFHAFRIDSFDDLSFHPLCRHFSSNVLSARAHLFISDDEFIIESSRIVELYRFGLIRCLENRFKWLLYDVNHVLLLVLWVCAFKRKTFQNSKPANDMSIHAFMIRSWQKKKNWYITNSSRIQLNHFNEMRIPMKRTYKLPANCLQCRCFMYYSYTSVFYTFHKYTINWKLLKNEMNVQLAEPNITPKIEWTIESSESNQVSILTCQPSTWTHMDMPSMDSHLNNYTWPA